MKNFTRLDSSECCRS